MTPTCREIGRRIVQAVQGGKRCAGYVERLIERLATNLAMHFGQGYGAENLEQMRRFYSENPRMSRQRKLIFPI